MLQSFLIEAIWFLIFITMWLTHIGGGGHHLLCSLSVCVLALNLLPDVLWALGIAKLPKSPHIWTPLFLPKFSLSLFLNSRIPNMWPHPAQTAPDVHALLVCGFLFSSVDLPWTRWGQSWNKDLMGQQGCQKNPGLKQKLVIFSLSK